MKQKLSALSKAAITMKLENKQKVEVLKQRLHEANKIYTLGLKYFVDRKLQVVTMKQ